MWSNIRLTVVIEIWYSDDYDTAMTAMDMIALIALMSLQCVQWL